MLVEVIFFSIVFVLLDHDTTRVREDSTIAVDWLTCLTLNPDDKNACLGDTHSWMVSYSAVSGVLMMLSLIGISVFFLLFRSSILFGWRDFFMKNVFRRKSFRTVGNSQSPQIRHLGLVSPTESMSSHPGLASDHHDHGFGGSPLSSGTAKEESPYSPSTPKLAQGSDYYDVSAYRARPGDAPGPGRYWHPNPNVQAAQREGIMRTLRMARARAQNAIQSQTQGRYPFSSYGGTRSPPALSTQYPHASARDAAELPPDSAVEKDY